MHKITFLILFLCSVVMTHAQTSDVKSTHGDKLTLECAVCHVTENWTKIKTDQFNHKKTNFPLEGQHKSVGCRQCHTNLDFSKAKSECAECHKDVHQSTVGRDCARCHNSNSWIVPKINTIHKQSGFPLIGRHAAADCFRCHVSASKLRFENLSTDCFFCHKQQYYNTKSSPFNHQALGLGTDCASCHNMASSTWNATINFHGIFPLRGGHSSVSCEDCHNRTGAYVERPPVDCKMCHDKLTKKANKSNMGHAQKFLSIDCASCHTPMSWSKVKYLQHNGFEIYTGEHKGKWNACTDCHNNDVVYKANCRKCHDFDKD